MSPENGTATWRRLHRRALDAVVRIAASVHPDYPEEEGIFAERLRMFPEGCLMLEDRNGVSGYLVSHPWTLRQPPALNRLLGLLPAPATTYYLHDLALMPSARGCGAARRGVEAVVAIADRHGLSTVSLVAVGGSAGFWRAQGFSEHRDRHLDAALGTYGDDAHYMERHI